MKIAASATCALRAGSKPRPGGPTNWPSGQRAGDLRTGQNAPAIQLNSPNAFANLPYARSPREAGISSRNGVDCQASDDLNAGWYLPDRIGEDDRRKRCREPAPLGGGNLPPDWVTGARCCMTRGCCLRSWMSSQQLRRHDPMPRSVLTGTLSSPLSMPPSLRYAALPIPGKAIVLRLELRGRW